MGHRRRFEVDQVDLSRHPGQTATMTRAPGAGPVATRTPAAGAGPGQLGRHLGAGRLGVGAQAAPPSGPDPDTTPPSAPRPARRAACDAAPAAARWPPPAGRCPAPRPPRRTSPRPARPACRLHRADPRRIAGRPQPVELGEHLRGGQTAVGERQHPVQRRPGQHRRQQLPAAGADRGATGQRERHVRADLGRRSRPGRRGARSRPHSAAQPTSAAAASALPPAMPPATGICLAIVDGDRATGPGALGQESARPRRPGSWRPSARRPRGSVRTECRGGRRDRHVVGQVDGMEHRHAGRGSRPDAGRRPTGAG